MHDGRPTHVNQLRATPRVPRVPPKMPKDFESLLHEWKALKLEEFRGREHLRKHWKRSIHFAFEKREYLMNWLKDYNLLDNVGQQRQNMLYSARLADYACKRDRTLTQYCTILKNEDQLVRRRKKRQIYDEGPQAAVDPQGHLYYMRVAPSPSRTPLGTSRSRPHRNPSETPPQESTSFQDGILCGFHSTIRSPRIHAESQP